MTDIPIDAFLNGPRNPEHEALFRLIGTPVLDTHGVDSDHDRAGENTGMEWSDAELSELEDLLTCEISIQEIARLHGSRALRSPLDGHHGALLLPTATTSQTPFEIQH